MEKIELNALSVVGVETVYSVENNFLSPFFLFKTVGFLQ